MMLRNRHNESWSGSGGGELTKDDKRVSSRKFHKKASFSSNVSAITLDNDLSDDATSSLGKSPTRTTGDSEGQRRRLSSERFKVEKKDSAVLPVKVPLRRLSIFSSILQDDNRSSTDKDSADGGDIKSPPKMPLRKESFNHIY